MSTTPRIAPSTVERLLSAKQACETLGISVALLRRLVHSGDLAVVRLGRRRLFRPSDLVALVEHQRHSGSGRS